MVVCSKRVDEGRRSADTRSVVWVGKGITYDTGGLSLKPRDGMCGMKSDMGGSAAVFGAFLAAVQQPLDFDLHMILCLAENAIGPAAVRHDDVIRMYSGKTVEVNNTDAEVGPHPLICPRQTPAGGNGQSQRRDKALGEGRTGASLALPAGAFW